MTFTHCPLITPIYIQVGLLELLQLGVHLEHLADRSCGHIPSFDGGIVEMQQQAVCMTNGLGSNSI